MQNSSPTEKIPQTLNSGKYPGTFSLWKTDPYPSPKSFPPTGTLHQTVFFIPCNHLSIFIIKTLLFKQSLVICTLHTLKQPIIEPIPADVKDVSFPTASTTKCHPALLWHFCNFGHCLQAFALNYLLHVVLLSFTHVHHTYMVSNETWWQHKEKISSVPGWSLNQSLMSHQHTVSSNSWSYHATGFAPCGAGAPLFPLVHLLHLFPFSLFPFFHWLYLFSSFVHPFPFYQNSPTPFPGRRS